MSKENSKTLQAYDKLAKLYLEQSANHEKNDPEKAKKKFNVLTDDFTQKIDGDKNDKWFCLTLEKPDMVNPEVKAYIEETIFPDYDAHAGHGLEHIKYVIRRSLLFAGTIPDANIDMVYTIAAYHDIGRKIDNARHEIESAKIFLADDFMKNYFNDDERKIIAEAIEDHRASADHEPRSIYGKIVSSADRNGSTEQAIQRAYKYTLSLNPDFTKKEAIMSACFHLRKKYGDGGYALSKMFFKDPDYEKFLQDIEEITADPEKYMQMLEDICL